MVVMARSEHKRVVGCSGSELHVAGDALIGEYYRVHLGATLFHAASRNDAFRADSCNRCQP